MNTSILVDSLKYLTSRFIFISRLSKWIQESLTVAHYSDYKMIEAVREYDIKIIKSIIHLIINKSIVEDYINENYFYFSQGTFSLEMKILNLFYSYGFQYNQEYFIEKIVHSYNYDIVKKCDDKILLNKLLDRSIILGRYDLSILLIDKGAVLDKLTFQDTEVLCLPVTIFSSLAKTLDKEALYQLVVNIIMTQQDYHGHVFTILLENSFLKDQNLFNLVVENNLELCIGLFLQDGFDPDSIKISEHNYFSVIYLLDRYKKWRI